MTIGHGEVDDQLVRALMNPALYDHPVDAFQLIETHISWILLTGPYAYKIKKPVNLGFLDFSALDRRRFYCEEELRLNRRLAAPLYLSVVPITGTCDAPRIGGEGPDGEGPVIEYAVKMRQFPQEAQLDRLVDAGLLDAARVDELAAELAVFHQRADRAPADSSFGTPERIAGPMLENFEQVRPYLDEPERVEQYRRLRAWSESDHTAHRDDFLRRRAGGFVRECHGDLHLANMVLWEGRLLIFDCLEFDEYLRWIDVMSDLAFVTMDLERRGRAEWAGRLLNGYLERTGDYAGLSVLRSYQVYRAMVRAKVAVLQRQQSTDDGDRLRLWKAYCGYVDLAERYTRPIRRWMVITHGYSGSGKTVLSGAVAQAAGAIRVRSDVERKRLFGVAPSARSGSKVNEGLYTAEAGVRTYQRLAELAHTILDAGRPVIIDGAFLRRGQRETLRAVAARCGAPFVILDAQAPEPLMRERLRRREREGVDASEAGPAVLDQQLTVQEPLGPDEEPSVVRVRTEEWINPASVITAINHITGA
jgi:aminoglycoside phosphotransferase family enzyme/gluconate kinase